MNEQDLVTDAIDSLSGAEGNVENPNAQAEAGVDAFADAFLASSGIVDAPSAETEVVEESDEVEELSEDITDETPVEAEAEATEEETDLEVNDDAEISVLSYQDLFDQVGAVEINGESYTPAQLKSILGQEVSAGKKAREAAERLKEMETREAKLQEQENWLQQRSKATQQSDQLVQMQSEGRKINAAIKQAREEGDMYELSVQKDKMDQLNNAYRKAQKEVNAVSQRQEAEMYQRASKGLKDVGMGYLLEDNKDSQAWTTYASNNLAASEVKAVTLNPQLAAMVEKARKWDIANGKQGKKLTSKSPTLKTQGSSQTKLKQQRKAAMTDAMKRGQGDQQSAEAGINAIARELFGDN